MYFVLRHDVEEDRGTHRYNEIPEGFLSRQRHLVGFNVYNATRVLVDSPTIDLSSC